MKLFPTFELPEIVENQGSVKADYKESIHFDINKGDIVLDSAGRIKIADGCEAWLQWCMKMIASERNTLLAYPTGLGVEMEQVSSLMDREAKETAIESTIKETLMSDPSHRTVEVKDFEYAHDTDSIIVTFCIVGADGYTGKMTVEIEG